MHTSRLIALAVLPLVLATSVGCRQLMRGSDEIVDAGRRLDVPSAPSPVRGAAEKVAGEAIRYGVTEAIAAAKAEGATPGTDLPSLAGRWRQTDDMGDGLAMSMIIDRTPKQAGVYAVKIQSFMTLDGNTLLTMTGTALEVISRKKQCQFYSTIDVQYANDAVRELLEGQGGPITEATVNEAPCSGIRSIDGGMIRGVDEDGIEYVEVLSPM